jgi:hypothetical protein
MKLKQALRQPRTRLLAALIGLCLAGGAFMASAPAAMATSLSEQPYFDCYSYTSGASLRAYPPKTNEGETYTAWAVVVYRWNGSSWTPYQHSRAQAYNNEAFSFGEIASEADVFNVPRNGYYRAKYLLEDTGDSAPQYTWANAIHNHYSANTCKT